MLLNYKSQNIGHIKFCIKKQGETVTYIISYMHIEALKDAR